MEVSDQVSGLTSRGTLTLCDLAGSERISRTEAEGQRLVEAAAINRSLTALGQVGRHQRPWTPACSVVQLPLDTRLARKQCRSIFMRMGVNVLKACSPQVFSALKCNALHIPFRNSKLTHLLQPCLSGDAKVNTLAISWPAQC